MEEPTKQYQYRKLKKNKIRLLNISPARSTDTPITVHLIHADIARCPDYQVLSYTWGDPKERSVIMCDGRPISVTENLMSALLALRASQSLSTYLWTDAICIDQANDVERGRMLFRMKEILGQAVRTILWVGREGFHSETAFKVIPKLVSARREVFQDLPSSHLSPHPTEDTLKRYREILSFPSPIAWKGLDDLVGRRIFGRAWTVPDIVFSRELLLRCGPYEAAWVDFCYGLEAYVCYSLPNELRHPGTQNILSMNNLREHRLTGKCVTPADVLETIRCLSATNGLDKVYAGVRAIESLGSRVSHGRRQQEKPKKGLNQLSWLKGIIPKGLRNVKTGSKRNVFHKEPTPEWITINYGKSRYEVYSYVAFVLNSNDEFVGTLYCSLSIVEDAALQRREVSPLPSWVPDWTFPRQIYHLNTMQSTFLASKGRSFEPPHLNGKVIMVFSGCVVDTINTVTSYLPPRRWYDKYSTSGANSFFFLEWIERAQQHARAKYKGQDDRLLLHWIETIQAKGCGLWEEFEPRDLASLIAIARSWLKLFEDEDQVETEEIRQFHAACLPSYGRRFGITGRGHFCLIPRFAERNDLVCIPFGSKVPFVFRKALDHYLNVGECYVHGAMNGEALAWDGIEEEEFVLR